MQDNDNLTNEELGYSEEISPELAESIEKASKFFTLDTFKGQIEGKWSIRQPGSMNPRRVSRYYYVSGFRGDVIFFDRSWTIAGQCDSNWPNLDTYSIDYDYASDLFTIRYSPFTFEVAHASSSNSPVQFRYDIASGKVMFIIRQQISASNVSRRTLLLEGSFMNIRG